MKKTDEEMGKEIEEKIEKNVERWVTAFVSIVVSVLVSFVVTLIILKFVWGWVVPDLFPGAVDDGLIVDELTWMTSLKLAILVAVLSGIYPTLIEAFKLKKC